MNKLIERLKDHAERGGSPIAYEAARALEAADRMAAVIAEDALAETKAKALTAYRNLTQETPHAG